MTHYELSDDSNIQTAAREWDSGIDFGPNTNTYKLIRGLLSAADDIDDNLEDVYDASHVDTATGDDLDKIADLINVSRKTGEPDEAFRARIKARFRAATTGTTYDNFVEFAASVLNTDVENVSIRYDFETFPARVDVLADERLYQEASLTPTQIRDLLEDGVPAGHEVQPFEGGTFELKTDDQIDDAEVGLTSDSIETGGTLSSELVE